MALNILKSPIIIIILMIMSLTACGGSTPATVENGSGGSGSGGSYVYPTGECDPDDDYLSLDGLTSSDDGYFYRRNLGGAYNNSRGLGPICASYAYERDYTGDGEVVSVLGGLFVTNHQDLKGTARAANSSLPAHPAYDKFTADSYNARTNTTGKAAIRCDGLVANSICVREKSDGSFSADIIAGENDGTSLGWSNKVHGVAYNAHIKAITILDNNDNFAITADSSDNNTTLKLSEFIAGIDAGSGSDIVAMHNGWGRRSRACIAYDHDDDGTDTNFYYARPHGQAFNAGCTVATTTDHTFLSGEEDAWLDAINDGTIVIFANGDQGLNNETGKVKLYANATTTTVSDTVNAKDLLDNANVPSFEGGFPELSDDLEDRWLNVVAVNTENYDSARPDETDDTEIGQIGSFSNACGATKDYCISAPGADIFAANRTAGAGNVITNARAYRKGTSQAAAYVAGALAVLKEAFPNMDPEDLVNLILGTAYDLGEKGVDEIYGHGMLNLDNASRPQGSTNAVTTNNQTFGGGVLIQDTSLALANHFGGDVQNVKLGMNDDYDRAFITSVAQVTYQPVTIGLDTYMSDFTKPKGQTTELSPQVNMVISTEANKNWMNGQYQSGKSITSIAFHDSYQPNPFADYKTLTPDNLRASHIRPASNDIAQMNATHRLNTNLVLTSYAGHGRYDTGHDFTELGNDIYYNKDSYFMNLGVGHLREYEQFLGANGTGAYAMKKPALSRFTDVSMGKALNDKFSIYGNYTHYQTDVTMSYEEFARIEGLEANQYQVGLKGKNILQNDDALKIVLATKLGVTDGDMVQNTVLGYKNKDYNNVTQYYDLSTQERHQQLSLSYQGKLAQNNENKQSLFSNNRFFTTLNIDRNMHHQTGLSHTEIISGVTAEF